MIYLPDTNAVSNFLRGNNPALTARMHQEFPYLRLSALVVAEREFGSLHHRSGLKYRRAFEALVSSVPIEAFSREDAAHYAGLRSYLEKRGQGIGPIDTLIAAQALRLGATVVTHNAKEFSRVPGLHVEDWQSP
ncbi:MAG: type II toxin-antitoxin system VapC family toxin [Verrucomicrobia bacterium]|nr:type II toxin-antitoxin system VapC family toxin [Verrucomicrobiota bacterium]